VTRALITGVTGQDGSYLAEQLLALGYEVHGVVRDTARARSCVHLAGALERLVLHESKLDDADAVRALIQRTAPERIFHLAAESYAGSFDGRSLVFNVASTALLLEAMRLHAPHARLLLAGSGAQLAGASVSPQNEETPPSPLTPYALSKQLASNAVRWFREREGLFAVTALLYNHESPRRGERFVSRKIARAAARAARDPSTRVQLGDLDAGRDWGFAPEYTEGMRRILEHGEARDFVLATGRFYTVRDMVTAAFAAVGKRAEDHVVVDDTLKRAPDPIPLVGDARQARALLAWEAQTPFAQLVETMIDAEMRAL
jgi:GDPmannose 4,6-dehydratase